MDSRQQFEEWYSKKGKHNYLHLDFVDDEYIFRSGIDKSRRGEYVHEPAQDQWDSWQASRAAIVIELPSSIGVTPIGGDGIQEYIDCNGEYLHGFAVVEAIINAGLTLK